MITKKQKAAILADYGGVMIDLINIVSKSDSRPEVKMKLVSFLLMIKDVVDLEKERLDYSKVVEAVRLMES